MSNHAHQGKRKERDGSATTASPAEPCSGAAWNRLLAGYLAHEFLTAGTLLGERWDPELPNAAHDSETERGRVKAPKAYADVARLLKADGAHMPGVVNPTQLARRLQS